MPIKIWMLSVRHVFVLRSYRCNEDTNTFYTALFTTFARK